MTRLPRYIELERPWDLRFWLLFVGLGIVGWSPFAFVIIAWMMLT